MGKAGRSGFIRGPCGAQFKREAPAREVRRWVEEAAVRMSRVQQSVWGERWQFGSHQYLDPWVYREEICGPPPGTPQHSEVWEVKYFLGFPMCSGMKGVLKKILLAIIHPFKWLLVCSQSCATVTIISRMFLSP